MTYDFYSLDGRFLETITTDSPGDFIGELSRQYGVDVDEITWEVAS